LGPRLFVERQWPSSYVDPAQHPLTPLSARWTYVLIRQDEHVARWLVWAGGGILIAVIPWMLWDLFTYAVLTPTRKSPPRTGDLDNRRFFGRLVVLQSALAACGAVMLIVGLATR
jgi:hypothetical protein